MATDLTKEIVNALQHYSSDVEEILEESKADISKKAVSKLKQTSPKGHRGKYAQSWKVGKSKNGLVVFNGTEYRLTHLLEFGHAKRNGGRTRAIPHIAPVADFVAKEFEDQVKRSLN